jgi:hypothetical protein
MRYLLIVPLCLGLAGCDIGMGGGGSGGGSGGNATVMQTAMTACVGAVEARGGQNVTVVSMARTSNGATGVLQSRRSPLLAPTRWDCRFVSSTGRASVTRA